MRYLVACVPDVDVSVVQVREEPSCSGTAFVDRHGIAWLRGSIHALSKAPTMAPGGADRRP